MSQAGETMAQRWRSLARVLGVAMLFAAGAVTAGAQTQGGIGGLVTDSSGAAMADAEVTVTNKATHATRKATTNKQGLYAVPSLPPGVYELKVEQKGFKVAEIADIKIDVQQTARLDVALEVGSIDETVTVSGEAALLNTGSTTIGTVIENKVVTELPLNGRQYLNLVAQAPNVNVLSPAAGQAGARLGGERAQQAISAGGQRIFFNYYTLDGVNNTDPNFQNYIAQPSIDAIQEFKVQTGVYPAEFGHQSTQVNVVTKSGGNEYHASIFEFLRDEKFDAKPYAFTSVRPDKSPFKWNDFGFEADGPVIKDKLFFMVNFEALRRRQTTPTTFTVPSDKMFTGDFSQLLPGTIIYDPNTGRPFPGNIIPASRIDPISKGLLEYYPSSTLPGLTNNYVQDNSQPYDRKGYMVRADFTESSSSQWMARYNWGDDVQSNQGLGLAGSKTITNFKQWSASNTRTLSATLVNDARFGYTKFFNSIGTLSAFSNDVVGGLGIPNLKSGDPVTWGIPSVAFTGFSGIGDITDGPFAVDNNTLQFVDKLTWVKGRHTIGIGAEFARQHFNEVGNQFSRGSFEFSAFRTRNPADNTGGYAFAEFLLGQPFRTSVALAIAEGKFVRNVFHAFVDDNWKVTNNLTLLARPALRADAAVHQHARELFHGKHPDDRLQPQPAAIQLSDACAPGRRLYGSVRRSEPPLDGHAGRVCQGFRSEQQPAGDEVQELRAPPRRDLRARGQDRHPHRRGALLHGRHRQRRVLRHGSYHRRPRRHASIGNDRTHLGQCGARRGNRLGATDVVVGGGLRPRDAAHLAVSAQRRPAAWRQVVDGVGLPRIAEPAPLWFPDPQPGRSRPAEQHQHARALSEVRRDLVRDRPEQRALQRAQRQGDAPLR